MVLNTEWDSNGGFKVCIQALGGRASALRGEDFGLILSVWSQCGFSCRISVNPFLDVVALAMGRAAAPTMTPGGQIGAIMNQQPRVYGLKWEP